MVATKLSGWDLPGLEGEQTQLVGLEEESLLVGLELVEQPPLGLAASFSVESQASLLEAEVEATSSPEDPNVWP